jgi:hypothetical protein
MSSAFRDGDINFGRAPPRLDLTSEGTTEPAQLMRHLTSVRSSLRQPKSGPLRARGRLRTPFENGLQARDVVDLGLVPAEHRQQRPQALSSDPRPVPGLVGTPLAALSSAASPDPTP